MDQRPSEPWGSQVGHRAKVRRMAERTELQEAAVLVAGFVGPVGFAGLG